MFTVEEATKMISTGKAFMIAGDEALLSRLPKGNWIGGTIPYFMSENGGLCTKDMVQLQEIPSSAKLIGQRLYSATEIKSIANDYAENGFTLIIIPGFSDIHHSFGSNSLNYHGVFGRPLAGWIAGVHVDQIGKQSPKVIDGATGEFVGDKAVAMHFNLPPEFYAKLDIINLFSQDNGETLEFAANGFRVRTCLINGSERNLSEYLDEIKFNIQLPLVADFSGAAVNISIQSVDRASGEVVFYSAVQRGIRYKFAKALPMSYPEVLRQKVPANIKPFFTCNCVLNYLYGELAGQKTGDIIGPMTFGEVAYMLLNQTIVYMTIERR